MPDKGARRSKVAGSVRKSKTLTDKDETSRVKNAGIATMLHKDMEYHRKRTAEFNEGWKGALCLASVALAIVSIFKAIEKARDGDPQWVERSVTSANALLIGVGVWGVSESPHPTPWSRTGHVAAFALSLYQVLGWWTSRQRGEHVDFPVAVILLVVAMAAVLSMDSTLRAVDRAYQASDALVRKVSTKEKIK